MSLFCLSVFTPDVFGPQTRRHSFGVGRRVRYLFGLFHHRIPRENRFEDGVIQKKKKNPLAKGNLTLQRDSHDSRALESGVLHSFPPARPSPTRPPTNVPTCSVHNHPPSTPFDRLWFEKNVFGSARPTRPVRRECVFSGRWFDDIVHNSYAYCKNNTRSAMQFTGAACVRPSDGKLLILPTILRI